MCILTALGLRHILCDAMPLKRVAAATAVMYLISFTGFTITYFGDHAKAMAQDFCSGMPEAVRYADRLDSDAVYVTCWSRDESAYTCSEIYTLFGASVDAGYFQGKADAYSANGKKLLPYPERYRYVDFDNFAFDQPAGTAYVYNRQESSLFPPDEFMTREFGGFGVAVKYASQSEPSPTQEEPVG